MRATTARSRSQSCMLAAFGMSLLAASGLAQAHFFCVSTAAALQGALVDSSDGGIYNGEDNYVRILSGLYKTGAATGGGPFFYHSTSTHQIIIDGGYSANCSSQSIKASLTTLDGNGTTGVLALRSANGLILVRTLTMQNGDSNEPGAGLQVNYLVSATAAVVIADTIIRNNHSSAYAGGLYASAASSGLDLQTSLIVGNSTDGQDGAGFVTGYGQYTQLYNNTVTQNTSSAVTNPTGGLFCASTTPCHIYNNIFWNNTTYDIYLGNSGAILFQNDYGARGGTAPASEISNLSVNPKFVDAAGGNFRLAGDSPLFGYGQPQGTITDLDGNPYPVSGMIDLGAYEETIFIDGFEGN